MTRGNGRHSPVIHAGDVPMVEFTVAGIPCLGLNGGPRFPQTGAFSFQITPGAPTEAMAAGGEEARRAFAAMLEMKKIDVAAIERARRG